MTGSPNVYVRFGKKVRQEKGISQEKLAELSGLHRTYVSSVKRGERNISLLNIEKVSMASLMPNFEKPKESNER